MPTYSTVRLAPNYLGCVSLDAVIERLASEHAALMQMRNLGAVFGGVTVDGNVKIATSAPNLAAKYGFQQDRETPPPVPAAPKITIEATDSKFAQFIPLDGDGPGITINPL